MKLKVIVQWHVSVFDRTQEQPLPFRTRHLILDWPKVPEADRRRITELLSAKRSGELRLSPEGSETISTLSLRTRPGVDRLFIPYRKYFVERTPEQLMNEFREPNFDSVQSETVNLIDEYIEDESGNALTMQDVMNHVAGGETVILDDVSSVLRVGPVDPVDAAAWTVRDSNTVAQFLRVVEQIAQSQWARTPITMSHRSTGTNDQGEIIHCLFPNEQEITTVMAWLRQLYSADDLFNHTCNLYLRQVRNGAKHDWLAYVRHKFNELRDDEPFLPNIPHVSHRQLIDLFAYGARILHRESEENAEEELKELVRLHGREQVAMAINACMHDLVGRANLAYHLIRADFNDWLNRNLIPPPDAPDARELLRSNR